MGAQRRHGGSLRARAIDGGRVALLGRTADDAAIHEGGASALDHMGDDLGGVRVHRVQIGEDGPLRRCAQMRRHALGESQRVAGRHDGEDEIGLRHIGIAR